MAYSCLTPEVYSGKKVGNGQCVVFVQKCAGAPYRTLEQGREEWLS